jgi:hypothetical protein
LKKPKLTGGNLVPVNHQKEWRPRIVLDDRRPSQQKGKKSVFVRLGYRNAASRNLIPKKSVFDRLQFDLNQSSFVKRKLVFDRIQLPEARSSWAKKLDQGNVSSMAGTKHSNFNFSNSNAADFKAGTPHSRFCIRCLRVGHVRSSCHSKITCHRCNGPGHIATTCRGLNTNKGFKPKKPPTYSFERNDPLQGKETNVLGWF